MQDANAAGKTVDTTDALSDRLPAAALTKTRRFSPPDARRHTKNAEALERLAAEAKAPQLRTRLRAAARAERLKAARDTGAVS